MPEWPVSIVGQHVTRRVEPVKLEPETEYSSLGIRYNTGVYVRDVKLGAKLRTKMYRARAGDFMYCILDSQRGPFDIVPDEFDGAVVTNKFPTYEVGQDLVAGFLRLVFQRHSTLESIGLARQGAEGRSEWKPEQFEAHPIPFPPKAVQEQIVAAVGSVDALIRALDGEVNAVRAARGEILHELLRQRDDRWDDSSLVEVGSVTRGKRFTKANYVESGIGCIHYAEIHTVFGATAREVVSFLPEDMRGKLRFAEPGDLVVAGTSENLEGVLKAVSWLGEEPVAVHDDAYIVKHNLNSQFAPYLFAAPEFRDQVRHVATDAKVVRVSKEKLEQLVIPVPPPEVQISIAESMRAIDAQLEAVQQEVNRVRTARGALLEALLARDVDVVGWTEASEA